MSRLDAIRTAARPSKADVTRFWTHVDRSPVGCWEWKAAVRNTGYGSFWVAGRTVNAHRFAYETFIGEVPADLHVCHQCDNRRCVRPAHMFLGTNAENQADKASKGRSAPQAGAANNAAKLSPEDVGAILRRYRIGESQAQIAADFPVSRSQIQRIVTGDCWSAQREAVA